MFQVLMHLFIECSEQFVQTERKLILSGVSERCLCGAFMTIFRKVLDKSPFSAYYADIEYNRNFDGQIKTIIDDHYQVTNITCDLIIHSRGENSLRDNLIAIEMKRDNHPEAEKNKDRIRLRALTKPTNDSETFSADGRVFPQHVCGYILGVFYEISLDKNIINIQYFRRGEIHGSYSRPLK